MSESKLNKAGLLGTPLSSLQHDSKRSSGNATSAQTLTTPAGKQDNYMGTGATPKRNGSPLKQNRLPTSSAFGRNLPTLSPSVTATPSFAGSAYGGTVQDEHEALKGEIQKLQRRTRIVADPALVSTFSKADDPELYALFRS